MRARPRRQCARTDAFEQSAARSRGPCRRLLCGRPVQRSGGKTSSTGRKQHAAIIPLRRNDPKFPRSHGLSPPIGSKGTPRILPPQRFASRFSGASTDPMGDFKGESFIPNDRGPPRGLQTTIGRSGRKPLDAARVGKPGRPLPHHTQIGNDKAVTHPVTRNNPPSRKRLDAAKSAACVAHLLTNHEPRAILDKEPARPLQEVQPRIGQL